MKPVPGWLMAVIAPLAVIGIAVAGAVRDRRGQVLYDEQLRSFAQACEASPPAEDPSEACQVQAWRLRDHAECDADCVRRTAPFLASGR